MSWFDRSGFHLIVVIGAAVLASPARADMEVLESNVPGYPPGKRIEGNAIGPLRHGERVKVLILEENKTRLFEGDPPWRRSGFGTRGPRKHSE
jgi:hypothetical protein